MYGRAGLSGETSSFTWQPMWLSCFFGRIWGEMMIEKHTLLSLNEEQSDRPDTTLSLNTVCGARTRWSRLSLPACYSFCAVAEFNADFLLSVLL